MPPCAGLADIPLDDVVGAGDADDESFADIDFADEERRLC